MSQSTDNVPAISRLLIVMAPMPGRDLLHHDKELLIVQYFMCFLTNVMITKHEETTLVHDSRV